MLLIVLIVFLEDLALFLLLLLNNRYRLQRRLRTHAEDALNLALKLGRPLLQMAVFFYLPHLEEGRIETLRERIIAALVVE